MKSAEIKNTDGSVGLYIDGVKVAPIFYALSDIPGSAANTYYAYKNIKAFGNVGINLVSIDAELRDGWFKAVSYEWESIKEEIAAVLCANPDAKVLIRLHVNPPYWWLRDNPDEEILYDGVPGIDNGEQARLIANDSSKHKRVSLASEKWLSEAGERLRIFCQSIENTPEGEAILAIQVACGKNGEWHQWGTDTSSPMRRRFDRYIREKYKTEDNLREAWGDPRVTFESAEFSPSKSQSYDEDGFRHPTRSARIIDSQYCIQLTVAEAIIHFCKIVKDSFTRPVLAGAFYAYYIGPGGKDAVCGHLLPELIFEERKYIDFLCGPYPYIENRFPEYMPMQRGILESARLHNILWLIEVDTRPAGFRDFPHGDPERFDETVSMLRRTALQPLLSGEGFWYYDHRGDAMTPEERRLRLPAKPGKNTDGFSSYRKVGWWDTPELMAEIGKMQKIYEKHTVIPYESAADVLFVYVPKSHFLREDKERAEYFFYDALYRTGICYDCIYVSELALADMSKYKAVIFMDAYSLTKDDRALIKKKTEGKETLFLFASGFADERELSVDGIRDITGINVKKTLHKTSYRVKKTGKINKIYAEEPTPYFQITDDSAEPLAYYDETDEVAAAKRGHVWYFPMLKLDFDIALDFIESSGAHRYTDSREAVFAGAGLLALHTVTGGERKITLKCGKEITVTLTPHTTAIFNAKTGERLA